MASIFRTEISPLVPNKTAGNMRSSNVSTQYSSAFSTTRALVRILPAVSMTSHEPTDNELGPLWAPLPDCLHADRMVTTEGETASTNPRTSRSNADKTLPPRGNSWASALPDQADSIHKAIAPQTGECFNALLFIMAQI